MKAKTVTQAPAAVPVSKSDLIAAWSVLEKIVVSLRKIGSAHAASGGQAEQTSEQHQHELEAIDRFFSPEVLRELSRARRLLAEYLPGEEIEGLSEHSIQFWSPGDSKVLEH
jgi:hypothetical protein